MTAPKKRVCDPLLNDDENGYTLAPRSEKPLRILVRILARTTATEVVQQAGGLALVIVILTARALTGSAWMLWLTAFIAAWWFLSWFRQARIPVVKVPASNLDDKLDELRVFAASCGIKNLQVMLLDDDGTDTKAWAAYTRTRRRHAVYFSENMLDLMEPAELKAIFAHELGHVRLGHGRPLWRSLAASVTVAIAAGVLPFGRWGGSVSVAEALRVAPLVLLTACCVMLIIRPVELWLSRRDEFRANEQALEITGDPAVFAAAMSKLAKHNLTTAQPSLPAKLLVCTHPSLDETLRQARRYADRNGIKMDITPGRPQS